MRHPVNSFFCVSQCFNFNLQIIRNLVTVYVCANKLNSTHTVNIMVLCVIMSFKLLLHMTHLKYNMVLF